MSKKKILITNDDGITAPGIKYLWDALKDSYDLTIVAPSSQKSGAGVSTTMFFPLHVKKFPWENNSRAYSVSGTPADCIKIALSELLENKPDIIVSGINSGSNAGRNVLYSGTIGAVIEGAIRNIPGIAFSCFDVEDPDYKSTLYHIPSIVDYFCNNKIPEGSFINVTFPSSNKQIQGLRFTKHGKSYWTDNPEKRFHPSGHSYFWLGGKWKNVEEDQNSDVHWLDQGYITAVPFNVNELTDNNLLKEHKESFESIYNKNSIPK